MYMGVRKIRNVVARAAAGTLAASMWVARQTYGAYAATVTFDGGGDGTSWEDGENWSGDVAPGTGDDAVIPDGFAVGGAPASGVLTLTVNGGSAVGVDIAVSGGVIFNGSAQLDYGSITGDAVFNFSSYSSHGTIDGDATFNDDSANYQGTVDGDAVFNDQSHNDGVVDGDTTFNDYSYNSFDGGYVYGFLATFNDHSKNYGIVAYDAAFNGFSVNDGTVSGNACFAYTATNSGTVDGDTSVCAFSDTTDSDVSIDSSIEINDTTANGPILGDYDNFGVSLAAIGDLDGDGVEDLVIGSVNGDAGGSDRGAVHVLFMNADGSVDSTVAIDDTTANGPVLANGDQFGKSVAAIGDLDGDGVEDLAVGASGDSVAGASRGAVHILFMNANGSLDSTVKIDDATANGPMLSNFDSFGTSVAALGDLDGDGVEDLAVGAYGDDAGGGGRGAVHVLFMNADGSVDSTVEINDTTANGPVLADVDRFGTSVAAIGDLDVDGVTDLAVGADADDSNGPGRGAVHVLFMNADGSVDSTAKIDDTTANGPVLANNDYFGISVAAIGDLDGDGTEDIAVGAKRDDAGGPGRGAVHVLFMNADGSVDSTGEIDDATANGPVLADYDFFGSAVAAIGDLDGDGVEDIAVGAEHDNSGGAERGAVHVLFLASDSDAVAPSVSLTTPANLATVSGAAVSLTATASDDTAVSGVQFKLDADTAVGAEDTSAPFAATWDSTGVADGDHTLSAVARDAAGNYATSTVTVTVSNAVAEDESPRRSSSGRRERRAALGRDDTPRAERAAEASTLAVPASPSSGSSGSSGSPAPGTATSDFAPRDLETGVTGEDVRALQRFLNAAGFTLAADGPGSPGSETDRFGALTRAALARWQAANGVSPALGYYGPRTRAAIAAGE